MRQKKWLRIGVVFSFFLFLLALILFNDFSFPFLGIGIMILGIVAIIKINEKE